MSPPAAKGFETVVLDAAGDAFTRGVDPASAEAAPVVTAIVGAWRGDDPDTPELRSTMADRFAIGSDVRVERYRQLLATTNGWPVSPLMTPTFDWAIAALRAHPR